MWNFFLHIFSTDFMPHGFCYRWAPEVLWLNALADVAITLSYYMIPLALATFVRKRPDVPFHWMFVMFGIFIFGCGTTHLMEVWTIWHPAYRLAGIIKSHHSPGFGSNGSAIGQANSSSDGDTESSPVADGQRKARGGSSSAAAAGAGDAGCKCTGTAPHRPGSPR